MVTIQFQRKGHEEKYRFNANIQDHAALASMQLEKLASQEKEKLIIDKSMKELKEGSSSLAERKHIRFVDQAENGWDAVIEYISYSFANDEDDDKRLDVSDRAAGVKKHQKASTNIPKQRRFPVLAMMRSMVLHKGATKDTSSKVMGHSPTTSH